MYLRVEYRLFPLRQLVGLFRCRFGSAWPVLALQSALPPHAPSILSLLTGIASARPSALVEGGGLEPPAHPRLFGESPPLWSDAVAFISVGVRDYSPYFQVAGLLHRFRLFPSLYRGTYLLG